MKQGKIRVATCQFPVSRDIDTNFRHIRRQMEYAASHQAQLVHFSECALSRYLGVDLKHEGELCYERLRQRTQQLQQLSAQLGLWTVLGSTHQLSKRNKPHNSLYVIHPSGRIVDRYNKMFCAGDGQPRPTGDLAHYSPGEHFVTLRVNGVKLGLLICHEYRYPELYCQYKSQGVQLVLHSYHNGGAPREKKSFALTGQVVRAAMQARAASSYVWISANNSCRRASCWGSFVVRPDGLIVDKAPRHSPKVLLNDIDTGKTFYDASVQWRDRAIGGVFHSGRLVRDERSRNRTAL